MDVYIFPRTRFVDVNSIQTQIKHLESEVVEVKVAYASPYIERLAEELNDVIHSSETALRILEYAGCLVDGYVAVVPTASVLPLYSQVRRLVSRMELVRHADTPRSMVIALCFVVSSASSALQCLAREYDVDLDAVRDAVIKKNAARGYYAVSNLAQTSRPAGAHSGSQGRALPASPSHQQEKGNPSNGPMGNAI